MKAEPKIYLSRYPSALGAVGQTGLGDNTALLPALPLPGIFALGGARGDPVGLRSPIPSPGASGQRCIPPPCLSFAELRRFHLCLLRRGNDRQDDCTGDFWEEMLLGRHVEPPGLLHRHRRVSAARWVPLSLCLSVCHSWLCLASVGFGGSDWFAVGKAGCSLGIGAVGVVRPGSTVGIATRTTAVPPVLSIARGRAGAQLMEQGRATKAVCGRFWPAGALGAPHWAMGSALLPRFWFPSGEVTAERAVGSSEQRAREDSAVKCA